MTNRIITGESPEIVIELIDGDAAVRGWPHPEVLISVNPSKLEMQQNENGLRIKLRDDASLQIPAGSRLRIERVAGDIAINGVTGSLSLGAVSGDAVVRQSGPLTIEQIDGDLSVMRTQGDCTIKRVAGDAAVQGVAGTLRIEDVGDDLSIRGAQGSVYATAADDVSLRFEPRAGCTYQVRAGKNLDFRFPALTSAQVKLEAGEGIGMRGVQTPPVEGKSASFRIGGGEATIELTAGKRINLRGAEAWVNEDYGFDFGPEVGARMAEFAKQMEEQVNSVARQVEEKINAMGGSEEVANRIQERILAAARRAEEKINDIMRNAEARGFGAEAGARGPDRGQRHGPDMSQRRGPDMDARGMGRGGRGWAPPAPPMPPAPPAPKSPVTDEERMMVLRMVSEGSISVEQAEKLLAALNGKPGAA